MSMMRAYVFQFSLKQSMPGLRTMGGGLERGRGSALAEARRRAGSSVYGKCQATLGGNADAGEKTADERRGQTNQKGLL
jgi:hypothetical protein